MKGKLELKALLSIPKKDPELLEYLEKKLGGCIKLIVVKGNSGKQYHDIFETLYFQYNKERLRTSFQNNPNYTALLSMIDFGSLQNFVFLLKSHVQHWRQCQCQCCCLYDFCDIHIIQEQVTLSCK